MNLEKILIVAGLLLVLNACESKSNDEDKRLNLSTAPSVIVPSKSSTTSKQQITIIVQGEIGAVVYINGVQSSYVIGSNGTVKILLDVSSKSNGTISFQISLKNNEGNMSETYNFEIQKVPTQSSNPSSDSTVSGVSTDNNTPNTSENSLEESTSTSTSTSTENNQSTIKDISKPIITILGENPISIIQNNNYQDAGATAQDDKDGTLTVKVSGSVDTNTIGQYFIHYKATDKSENEALATRTVNVIEATVTPILKEDVVWNVSDVNEFRQALENAAANGENDTIILAAGVYKTSNDNKGTFKFNDNEAFNLTIKAEEGLSYNDVILDGDNTNQVFHFNNSEDSTLTLQKISILHGTASSGAGFSSSGNTVIKNCNISYNNNENVSLASGGGFLSNGSTTIKDSLISYNRTQYYGGGFYSNKSTTIDNSQIINNGSYGQYSINSFGGGFYSQGATSVTNSIISNNVSDDNGGGLYSWNTTTISNSTFSDNHSTYKGGAIYIADSIHIETSKIINNSSKRGGGIYSLGGIINSTTLSQNRAIEGGAIFSEHGIKLSNALLFNNTAPTGAGFYIKNFSDTSYISNNNFIGNSSALFTYKSAIFINNIFDRNSADIILKGESKIYNNYIDYTKINDQGYNVINKNNLQPASVGDIYLAEDKKTLTSNSPVINKGLNPSTATYKKIIANDTVYNQLLKLLKTDMLGNRRVHNSTIDMGAVEFGSSK